MQKTVRKLAREEIRLDRRRIAWRWGRIIVITYVSLLILEKSIEVLTKTRCY